MSKTGPRPGSSLGEVSGNHTAAKHFATTTAAVRHRDLLSPMFYSPVSLAHLAMGYGEMLRKTTESSALVEAQAGMSNWFLLPVGSGCYGVMEETGGRKEKVTWRMEEGKWWLACVCPLSVHLCRMSLSLSFPSY